jgi:hypothetical protein
MAVVGSAEVGMEQACAWEPGGEGVGHTPRRKGSVTAAMSNQQRFRVLTGVPRGRLSLKPRGSASMESESVQSAQGIAEPEG